MLLWIMEFFINILQEPAVSTIRTVTQGTNRQ